MSRRDHRTPETMQELAEAADAAAEAIAAWRIQVDHSTSEPSEQRTEIDEVARRERAQKIRAARRRNPGPGEGSRYH